MKIVFLGDVIFEGDEETTKAKYEEFKEELTERLDRLYEELPNLYPKREIDTNETYFENLKVLNPVAYEDLSYIKDLFGDKFLEFDFYKISLAGIYVRTTTPQNYKSLQGRTPSGHKIYSLFQLYSVVTMDIKFKDDILHLEE